MHSVELHTVSRTSDGGGGESDEIVELSIEKHWQQVLLRTNIEVYSVLIKS